MNILLATAKIAEGKQDLAAEVKSWIMHHMVNNHEVWHLPFGIEVELPGILSLHAVMLLLAAGFLVIVFGVIYKKKQEVPTGITNLLEIFIIFIRDEICIPNLGKEDGRRMTPLFCSFFFFIVTLNLIGLVPYFATATANVSVTAGLALITLMFMIFGGIYKNGIKGFCGAFIPHGVPIPVLFIITPIEFVGMFIKSIALTIRLFANMLAGHIVIFSLLSLIVTIHPAVAVASVPMALCIYLMEVFIAFLQTYIFCVLSAMFIGQIYHPEH